MKKYLVGIMCALMLIGSVWASGTGAGQTITANAVNITLTYSNGITTDSKTAPETNPLIIDWTDTVKAIDGLVADAITPSALTGLVVGTDYPFSLSYLNRGNRDIDLLMNVAGATAHWDVATNDVLALTEDQLGTLMVTVNALNGVTAFEKVTLDMTASISVDSKNVVSYNAFTGAIGFANGSSSVADVAYGGTDNISVQYVLTAAGYDLVIVSRGVTVEAPPGYEAQNGLGGATALVPGAKVKFTIVIKNNSSVEATNVTLKDQIPYNTSLYAQGSDAPSIKSDGTPVANAFTGAITGLSGVLTSNPFDIPGNGYATMNYVATVDGPGAPVAMVYTIGQPGEAGIVFYDKGSYSDGWRYLEAASADYSGYLVWGEYGVDTGADGTAIGTGKTNTEWIVNNMTLSSYPAFQYCANLTEGGKSDWFLPAKDELNALYVQKTAVGGFDDDVYWSSSEDSSDFAWYQSFASGFQYYLIKGSDNRVRPVRAF